jgi:hypothetical protein
LKLRTGLLFTVGTSIHFCKCLVLFVLVGDVLVSAVCPYWSVDLLVLAAVAACSVVFLVAGLGL